VSDGVELRVRLTPRAARSAVELRDDGTLAVRVGAPPVDGQANAAAIKVVAKALGVAPSRVRLIRGERSREKTLRVDGLSAADVRERLAQLS
jgi:uncharacterized protein (TIGR00251 family)